jgi:hypothetical protein
MKNPKQELIVNVQISFIQFLQVCSQNLLKNSCTGNICVVTIKFISSNFTCGNKILNLRLIKGKAFLFEKLIFLCQRTHKRVSDKNSFSNQTFWIFVD